jgi:hypothetical protein
MMFLNCVKAKVRKWKREVLGLPFLMCSLVGNLHAQNNLSGQLGLMNVPVATMSTDGTFRIGMNFNPIHYALRSHQLNPEHIYYIDLTILPRLSVNVNSLYQIATSTSVGEKALGDRQIDVKYLILKEGARKPAIAIIMSSPFTIDAAMLTEVIVATKHIDLTKDYQLEGTLGYGSPFFVWRNVSNLENYDILSGFKLSNKNDYRYKNGYLTGLFAGIKLSYQNKIGLMTEWDSNRMNAGVYATIAKRFTIQASLLKGDQVMFGGAYACPLFGTPKALK